MAELTLVIGNKNYSSWSMRAGVAANASGLAFEEVVLPLDTPEFRDRIGDYSPSGKVPLLIHGDMRVWDSLAIIEYLAELAPEAGLWPEDRAARARARAVSAEMHSGFAALRKTLPMNIHRPPKPFPYGEDVASEIARILAIWSECLAASGGPFLFGGFGGADAMYTPVVWRLHTYQVDVAPESRAYMDAVIGCPAVAHWVEGALEEDWIIPHDEVD